MSSVVEIDWATDSTGYVVPVGFRRVPSRYLGINTDGTLDTGFNPMPNGVVYAIANHRHHVPFFLQPTNLCDLVGGKYFGNDAVDADFCADGFCRAPVVAGKQHDLKPQRVKIGNCLGARWLEPISNNKNGMSGKRIAVMIGPTSDDRSSTCALGVDAGLVKVGIDGGEQRWSTDSDVPDDS